MTGRSAAARHPGKVASGRFAVAGQHGGEKRVKAGVVREAAVRHARSRLTPTLEDCYRDLLGPHFDATLRSAGEYRDMMRLHVLPLLGQLRLDRITRTDVASLMAPMLARGLSASRINRVLAVARRSMNLLEQWDLYPGPNPARSPGMLREEPREHFLPREMLERLFAVLATDPDQVAAAVIALLALTGARRSEILNARFVDIDLARGLLTVPRSKSGRRRHVVLSDAAKDVLQRQPRAHGQVYVFPSARRPGQPLEGVRSAWARAKLAAALPAETRLHGLRHTFASLCVDNGVTLYEVSKLLGHSSLAVTARYSHLRDERLIAAANGVGSIAGGGGKP